MNSLILLALLACKHGAVTDTSSTATQTDPYDVQVGPYDADIRWTSYGIPHITGSTEGSLGYGMGYAFARDHACVLAD